jgi:hypothetical protein
LRPVTPLRFDLRLLLPLAATGSIVEAHIKSGWPRVN